MDGDITIQGNEDNGYMVVQKVEGEWLPISKRFPTYDEACDCIANIEEDIEPKNLREEFLDEHSDMPDRNRS